MSDWRRILGLGCLLGLSMIALPATTSGQNKGTKATTGFEALANLKLPASLKPPSDLSSELFVMIGAAEGRIDTLAVHPENKQLAMTAPNGKLQLYGIPSLKSTILTKRFPSKIVCTAYSPSGNILAMGDAEGTLHFWSVASTPIASRAIIKEAHAGGPIYTIAYAPDGKTLVSGGSDGLIRVWDASSMPPKLRAKLEGHEKYVRDLAFTPDSAVLASSGADDLTLRMWDLATDPPEALDVLKHEKPVASVAFSSDGRLMASGSYGDSLIRIWRTDEQHPKELGSFRAPRPNVRQVRFTPDGTKLIALVKNRDDDEIIFATLQGVVQKSWKFPHHLGGFVLTADGEHLITLNEDSVYIAKLANP